MNKYQRNYTLEVATELGISKEISPPFTIEFDVHRNILSSASESSIRVYNLNESSRDEVYKDIFDYDLIKPMELKAGYGDELATIFSGNISHAWSFREGVNFITQIESYDGGAAFVNSYTNMTFLSGMDKKTVMTALAASMKTEGVKLGKIGSYSGPLQRGNAYQGQTTSILTTLSQGGFFIDNGVAHILRENECIEGDVSVISSGNGLLGTPIKSQRQVTVEMMFEPRLLIGQIIRLNSSTGRLLNNEYKVVSIQHKGTISDAVCGDCITTVGLFQGLGGLTVI